MEIERPTIPKSREDLESMPKSALVEIVWRQNETIEQLIGEVEKLTGEVERLKRLLDKDSSDSSKPPGFSVPT